LDTISREDLADALNKLQPFVCSLTGRSGPPGVWAPR
jgi:hypothetical protein